MFFGLGADDMSMLTGMALYLALFVLPFVQEDAAVIGAATASLGGAGSTGLIVLSVMCGLVCSDAWKYWLGHFARRHRWAHKFAEKPGVSVAGDLVRKEFIQTMLTARFVPGTRIPTYIACGFFQADYPRYVIVLIMTASLYVGLMFVLFHTVGAVVGEQAKVWLPVIAIAILTLYVAYRWIRHKRNKALGPMTPLSDEPDRPLPEMADGAAPSAGGNDNKTVHQTRLHHDAMHRTGMRKTRE